MIIGGHAQSYETDARCGPLVMYYASVMKGLGADVKIRFYGDEEHDWLLMKSAKRTIAISPSSFAFSARVGSLSKFQMFLPPLKNQSTALWIHECEMRHAKPYEKTFVRELKSC